MPLSAQTLNSQREEFAFPYLGEELHIVYNPQGYTPELERRIQDSMASEYKAEALVFMLKTMLLDWDLEDVNGEQYGVEDEALMKLPIAFLADVVQGIGEQIRKVSDAGKASGGGSPQTANSGNSPTGTA